MRVTLGHTSCWSSLNSCGVHEVNRMVLPIFSSVLICLSLQVVKVGKYYRGHPFQPPYHIYINQLVS